MLMRSTTASESGVVSPTASTTRVPRPWRSPAATLLVVAVLVVAGRAGAQSGQAGTPSEAAADSPTRITITPGSVWNRGEDVPAGAVLELVGPGVHLPAVLEGLCGTEEAPIVVRRATGGGTVPFVVGGETGLLVRNCRHVLIEEIAFIGATRRAIRIERSSGIAIRNVLVARVGPDAEGDGIEIVESADVELSTIRFDGWQDAGLELASADDVRGRDLQFTALTRHRNRTAIRVGEGCRDVALAEFSTRAIPVAVEIGVRGDARTSAREVGGSETEAAENAENAGEPRTPSPPREIVIGEALLDRPEIACRLGDSTGLRLRRLTIVDPEIVFEIDAEALESARFAENLVVWNPGAMTAFARAIRGDEGLELGPNLWWSAELPAAEPLLGRLPGRAATPQRFSPDPRVAPRGHPTAIEAAGFGRPAPGDS